MHPAQPLGVERQRVSGCLARRLQVDRSPISS
jgi:hypothetical protein